MAQGLWNLYAGAGIQSSTAAGIGSTSALATTGHFTRQKRRRLEVGLAKGELRLSSLGAGDLATIGLSQRRKIEDEQGGRGIGGLFKNLGSDVYDLAKGIGPGIYSLGKAVAHDVAPWSGPSAGNKSELVEKILKPAFQNYKQTYSGDILGHLYKHPLQPILDVATLATGGAAAAAKAGTVASRAGVEGGIANLARLTSREGRAPAVTKTGIEIPREYTPRPASRLGQMGLDKLGQKIEPIGEFQGKRALQRELKLSDVQVKGEAARAIADIGKPMADKFKDLSIPEQVALAFSFRGINTPELIQAAQEGFRNSLGDLDVNEKANNLKIDRKYRETLARDDIGIADLVANPTDRMRQAATIWERSVQQGLEELPITPEQHQAAISSYQRRLKSDDPETPLPADGYQMEVPHGVIEPTYAPDVRAVGYEAHRQGEKLSKLTGGVIKPGELTFRRGPAERLNSTSAITSQNLLAPKAQRYLHDSTGETFSEGLFRVDPKLYIEHVAKREKDLIENGFNADLVQQFAKKKEDGELMRFKDADALVSAGLSPDDWVLVNPEYPIAWFRSETNFTKQAETIMKRLQDADSTDAAVLEKMLNDLTDVDAKAFITAHWGAMKRPGVAIPRDFFEYQKQLVEVTEPFRNPAMRTYVRIMHRWRNAVLAYMPRWAINTAIGSFITNMVKGVMNPLDYIAGDKLRRTYENASGEQSIRPLGRAGRDFDTTGLQRSEPVGVALQDQAIAEMLEPSMSGYQQAMDIRMPTRKLVAGVQHIEDFFRRASFIHSLKQIKRREGEPDIQFEDTFQGDEAGLPEGATEAMGDVLGDHYDRVTVAHGSIQEMLQDPRLVDRAIRDTNKFGYNYGALGPFERRVVRQFIPFWGWYKFISQLAYRLPVEFPGRSQALNQLSIIGNDAADDLGSVPDWMRGSIILGVKPDGTVKYLPTTGLNPFSSFLNPLSPKGAIEGTLSTGQLAPGIQAVLQAAGYDTLTGDSVRVSPQSGVTQDFLGRLINDKGEVVSARQIAPLRRGLMSLARSIPQVRLGEKHILEGGGSVYPESVPFLAERPMAPASGAAISTGSGATDLGLSSLGFLPRGYDLATFQQLQEKRARYNRTKRRRDMQKLKRKYELK